MNHKKSIHIQAVLIPAFILIIFCVFTSCTDVKGSAKTSREVSSGNSSTSIKEINFSSMTYQGPDTNFRNQGNIYHTTDKTIINKVWKALNTEKWTEISSLKTHANSIIILHFIGKDSVWYAITPDNFAYYSTGTGESLPQISILGFSKRKSDKSYVIPDNIYNSVSKLLINYTP